MSAGAVGHGAFTASTGRLVRAYLADPHGWSNLSAGDGRIPWRRFGGRNRRQSCWQWRRCSTSWTGWLRWAARRSARGLQLLGGHSPELLAHIAEAHAELPAGGTVISSLSAGGSPTPLAAESRAVVFLRSLDHGRLGSPCDYDHLGRQRLGRGRRPGHSSGRPHGRGACPGSSDHRRDHRRRRGRREHHGRRSAPSRRPPLRPSPNPVRSAPRHLVGSMA